MVKLKDMKVLILGTVPSVIKYIAAEFKKAGASVERVMDSKDILPKINEINPDIVVVDIQMEDISTYEVIEKVRLIPKKKVFLAFYSFFIDKEMAKESILHRLFASQTTNTQKDRNRPIKYLGIFNENTFDNKISTYLASLDD